MREGYKFKEDPFGLAPIWAAMLDIYKEIALVCDRHNLRYYVSDGTLIGAIRHKGFIPWDDDFDMSMPRPDYEMFIKIARTELPSHLRFLNWKNTPEFPLLFGKVHDIRKERILALEKETGRTLSNGLFVDIFPIDGYPDSKIEIATTRFKVALLTCIVRFKATHFLQQTTKGKAAWLGGCLLSCLAPWMSFDKCMRKCEGYLCRHMYETSYGTGRADLVLHMLNRPALLRQAWGDGVLVEFNRTSVRVPSGYDEYLHSVYGDYMVLPPESQRHPQHDYGYRCPWWLGPTKLIKGGNERV